MQPFRKERQNKPYKCAHCPKSFKSSNGLKYHLEKVHVDEENKMDVDRDIEVEGMTRRYTTSTAIDELLLVIRAVDLNFRLSPGDRLKIYEQFLTPGKS